MANLCPDCPPLLLKRRASGPRPPKERQILRQIFAVDIAAPLCQHRAMLGETQKPILPHPRSAEYTRERKKQIPISSNNIPDCGTMIGGSLKIGEWYQGQHSS